MNFIKSHIVVILSLLCLGLAACKDNAPQEVLNFGTERYDSAALHVALVPNRDCLPIYYAERTGLYDSLGLKLQIASYGSQMDCDTTLMGRIADGGWADRERMRTYGNKMKDIEPMWDGTLQWSIYTCEQLRIRDLKALKGRTISIARNSAEKNYLLTVLNSAKINTDDVYFPQINNLKMRAQMLTGNQIDAAVLTWPYTALAAANGHRCLKSQRFADPNACFVMKRSHLKKAQRREQWKIFEKGRKMALDSIRIKGPKAYSLILQKDYGIPKEIADTLKY